MDIWDALKLIARRWYASVPMIVLTLAALVWTLISVEPHHTSEGQIMLLPPSAEVPSVEGEERPINPWNTDTLTAAVVTRLDNQVLRDQLEAEGYRADWEAGTDLRFRSVLVIRTTANSPGDAQAAVQRLLEVVEEEIADRQRPYSLRPNEQITSLRLGSGENLAVARGNQARALVVVLGIGGILTMLVTVSVDVLHRSYLRRRKVGPRPTRTAVDGPKGAAAELETATQVLDRPEPGNGSEPEPRHTVSAYGATQPSAEGERGITVSYRPPPGPQSSPNWESPDSPNSRYHGDSEDATVVMPLARLSRDSDPQKSTASDTNAAGEANPR